MSKNRRLAYLALTFNALIWGAAFPLIKPAFEFVTPLQYLYFRFLVAGIISLPIFIYFYTKIKPKASYFIKVLPLEILQLLSLPVLYIGLDLTSSLEASLIGSTGPIFVILGGIIFLRERESRREWQGLTLTLIGSLLIVVEPLLTGRTVDTPSSTLGNLYIVGYNLIYAVYALLAKKIYRTHPPLYLGSLTYLIAALFYLGILNYQQLLPDYSQLLNLSVLFPVLYMAIPGGIIAFLLYLYAQSKIEVSEANLFTYLNGVVAIPAAFFILGEVPSWLTVAAILVIAYGVYRAETHRK